MAAKTVENGNVNKDIKMEGKTVVVTGANSGLGFVTAKDMAQRGARVIMACRNMEKCKEAMEQIIKESGSENVVAKKLDLSSLKSVRDFAADFKENEERLDVLINNAGVMMCPQSKTEEGFEMQFGTNHLGPFLLTNLLLEPLKKSTPSRIVTVSSLAHYSFLITGGKIYWDDLNFQKKYDSGKAYCQSKLMNVLFSRELSKRLQGTGVTSNSCEPGVVDTGLFKHVGKHENPTFSDRVTTAINSLTRRWWKTPEQGAQTQIYCAVAPELEQVTGKYFANCKQKTESRDARNDEYSERLWKISEEFVGMREESKTSDEKE